MLDAGMVAPPGPVSAEAFTFTLLKPSEGACTMTCASTVSPRALYRLMEEVVPGGSVCPTLARPGKTQTGNAEPNVVLRAMKTVRTTSTATIRQTLNVPKILRGCSLFWRLDLTSTFMGVLLPDTLSPSCSANKSETEISAGPHTPCILTRRRELPGLRIFFGQELFVGPCYSISAAS